MGSSYAVFDLFAHTCICGYTHQVRGREGEKLIVILRLIKRFSCKLVDLTTWNLIEEKKEVTLLFTSGGGVTEDVVGMKTRGS